MKVLNPQYMGYNPFFNEGNVGSHGRHIFKVQINVFVCVCVSENLSNLLRCYDALGLQPLYPQGLLRVQGDIAHDMWPRKGPSTILAC